VLCVESMAIHGMAIHGIDRFHEWNRWSFMESMAIHGIDGHSWNRCGSTRLPELILGSRVQVSRFFATNHYGRFLVFNLCESHEEGGNGNYDNSLLYNQVVKIPFNDHSVPTLHSLVSFLKIASEWLDTSPSHVVAVHCKGGKGRTGTFISALLHWVFFSNGAHGDFPGIYTREAQP